MVAGTEDQVVTLLWKSGSREEMEVRTDDETLKPTPVTHLPPLLKVP